MALYFSRIEDHVEGLRTFLFRENIKINFAQLTRKRYGSFMIILNHLSVRQKLLENRKSKRLAQCLQENSVLMCACCLDEAVIPENMLSCPAGHKHCSGCVTNIAKEQVGFGRANVRCLLPTCDQVYSLQILHSVLPPNSFIALLNYRVCEDVGEEDSPDLLSCPFCSYTTLVTNRKTQKTFKCLNPVCLEETCL